MIKKIYQIFPKNTFILKGNGVQVFSFKKKLKSQKKLIIKLLKNVYELCSYEFSSEEEILDYTNYDY